MANPWNERRRKHKQHRRGPVIKQMSAKECIEFMAQRGASKAAIAKAFGLTLNRKKQLKRLDTDTA